MIYVITVTYNPAEDGYLDQFIDCLNSQDIEFKTIIIDNNSQHRTVEKLKNIDSSNTNVIYNSSNVGFAAACNQGIEVAMQHGAEYIVFLNNDTFFEGGFLSRLSTAMIASDADAMSPLITYYPDTDVIWYAGGRFRPLSAYIPCHPNHGRSIVDQTPSSSIVDFASGCCLIVRRKLLENIGGFDENYFVYWEDADLCYRIRAGGYKIFFSADCKLFHIGSASTGGSNSEFSLYQFNKNHMIFMRKHFGMFFAILSLFYVLPKMLVKLVFTGFKASQCKAQIDGLRDGLNVDRTKLFSNTPTKW